MPTRHRLLAVVVAVCWGLNFLAIDASLQHFPPFFLVALRFALIAVPTMLFVPFPQVPVKWLVGYGLGFGTFQFLFLYWGMAAGMPAGLSSLVLQASAPFTVVLASALLGSRLSSQAGIGVLVAATGLAVVGWQRLDGPAAFWPFVLVLAGALAWAFGNLCTAQAKAPEPLHLTLWMSVVPVLPMLALSLAVEGPHRIAGSLTHWGAADALPAVAGLAYTVLIGTVLGSGIWTWLMARHPAGTVAPFSMLVPVVGMSAAWLVLGETVSAGEVVGAVLVVAGVLVATRPARRPAADVSPSDPRPRAAQAA
jgi:O-acetylserine/cysteine efflux transporter